jgi:hypothetical protein
MPSGRTQAHVVDAVPSNERTIRRQISSDGFLPSPWAASSTSRSTKVRRDARQHITEPTRDPEPRVAVKEQLFTIGHPAAPFGARETISLASFRLLTARTIDRLFLVTLSIARQAYAATSLAASK